MIEKQATDFKSLVDALENEKMAPDTEALTTLAKALAKTFNVDRDEVAVLDLRAKDQSLKFVIPEKLAAIGSIPLSSATALAARTARERRAEVVNNFSNARHASVFEGVPLGRDPGEMIQKIMSAPIMDGINVRGVVQISRKGHSSSEAGPDFTQNDLRTLTALSPSLHRFLTLCRPD